MLKMVQNRQLLATPYPRLAACNRGAFVLLGALVGGEIALAV